MTVPRDPVVARALADLPVPDHAPGFWSRLDERLAAEDASDDATAGADAGTARPDTGELPVVTALHPSPKPPRRQRLAFLAAAAAVAVVALVGGALLVADDDGDGTDLAATTTAPGTGTTEAPTTEAPTTAAPTTTATTIGGVEGGPQDAVRRWIDALGAGDTRTAAALVGPGSEAYLRSTGQTVEEFVTVASEGYGAWSASPDAEVVLVDIPDAGAVVVLLGTVTREGTTEQAVQALPVVAGPGGTWFVEPIAGLLDVVSPAPQPGYWEGQPPDAVLEAMTDDPDATYWFALDGEAPVEGPGGVWDPPGDLANGTHLLVIAAVGDGTFAARAGTFAVEG